jgi:hypothetical protein
MSRERGSEVVLGMLSARDMVFTAESFEVKPPGSVTYSRIHSNSAATARQYFPLGQEHTPLTTVPTLGNILKEGRPNDIQYVNTVLQQLATSHTKSPGAEQDEPTQNTHPVRKREQRRGKAFHRFPKRLKKFSRPKEEEGLEGHNLHEAHNGGLVLPQSSVHLHDNNTPNVFVHFRFPSTVQDHVSTNVVGQALTGPVQEQLPVSSIPDHFQKAPLQQAGDDILMLEFQGCQYENDMTEWTIGGHEEEIFSAPPNPILTIEQLFDASWI